MKKIIDFVNEYKLSTAGYEFWTPYAINEPGVPEGPFRGKGRPAEIRQKLNEITKQYNDPLASGEEVRYLMFRNNLGVDCSGFVYYVLDSYLKSQGKRTLDNYLFVDKADVVEAFKKESWQKSGAITESEITQLPDHVRLSDVCVRAQKDPIQITDVARLCSDQATIRVDLADIKPADTVKLAGPYGDHILLITEVASESITYAQSKFDPVGPGGVSVASADKSVFGKVAGYEIEKICRLAA